MVKKQKKEKNLYNFDYESKEEKKLRAKKLKEKKAGEKSASKKNKKVKANEKQGQAVKKKNYDDEIIIGVTRIPEKEKVKNEKKKAEKKKNNIVKQNKENNKIVRTKQKNEDYTQKIKKNNYRVSNQNNENSKLKKRKKILKLTILLFIVIGTIVFAMLSPLFNIKKIDVKGNSLITKEEIVSLSGIYLDENIFRTNKYKAINNIKQNTYINEVEINKKLPNTIEINVVERIPKYMLEYGNGYVYINNQGYMLEISSIKKELPILTGTLTLKEDYKAGNRLNDEDLAKLGTVNKIMKEAKNREIADLITSIDITNSNNYILNLQTEQKTVYLGDCSYIETRMGLVQKILSLEKGVKGEIFVNRDVNKYDPYFRESV